LQGLQAITGRIGFASMKCIFNSFKDEAHRRQPSPFAWFSGAWAGWEVAVGKVPMEGRVGVPMVWEGCPVTFGDETHLACTISEASSASANGRISEPLSFLGGCTGHCGYHFHWKNNLVLRPEWGQKTQALSLSLFKREKDCISIAECLH
jgi:hypothetical protein